MRSIGLQKARENKDIIQVNCVNDKLTGIRGFLKIAERSKKSLDQAKRQDDANLMRHEFAKVVLIGQRVDNLKLQVEGCVGEISQYTGNSQLTLEVDPDIRSDNPATTEAVPTFDALNTGAAAGCIRQRIGRIEKEIKKGVSGSWASKKSLNRRTDNTAHGRGSFAHSLRQRRSASTW